MRSSKRDLSQCVRQRLPDTGFGHGLSNLWLPGNDFRQVPGQNSRSGVLQYARGVLTALLHFVKTMFIRAL
jgi:hypothetical protein